MLMYDHEPVHEHTSACSLSISTWCMQYKWSPLLSYCAKIFGRLSGRFAHYYCYCLETTLLVEVVDSTTSPRTLTHTHTQRVGYVIGCTGLFIHADGKNIIMGVDAT